MANGGFNEGKCVNCDKSLNKQGACSSCNVKHKAKSNAVEKQMGAKKSSSSLFRAMNKLRPHVYRQKYDEKGKHIGEEKVKSKDVLK